MDCRVKPGNDEIGTSSPCRSLNNTAPVSLCLVTSGLDPVVRAEVRLSVDARVKPGHDERKNGTLQ
jgi:hypothetical protein